MSAAIDVDRIADDMKCEEINPSSSGMLRLGILKARSATRKMRWRFVRCGPSLTLRPGISSMPQKLVLDIVSGTLVQLAQFMPSHLNCFMRQAPLFC